MRELWIRERRRVRVLCARGRILCFRPSIRAHVISYRLDRKQPVSRSLPWFFRVCTEKNPVRAGTMLNMDDTLDVEDIVMIFDYLEAQNYSLQISFSWRRLFLRIFSSVLHVMDNYACGLWPIKRTRIGLRSQSPIQSSLISRAKADSRFRHKCPSHVMGNTADTMMAQSSFR